jgi:hypothetical protein
MMVVEEIPIHTPTTLAVVPEVGVLLAVQEIPPPVVEPLAVETLARRGGVLEASRARWIYLFLAPSLVISISFHTNACMLCVVLYLQDFVCTNRRIPTPNKSWIKFFTRSLG